MSGISSPWGMSPTNVAGIYPSLDYGDSHLTGQLGMTSTPISFSPEFVSPLTLALLPLYTSGTQSFGKHKKCIKLINQDINYLKK